jgi:hypothetical protein
VPKRTLAPTTQNLTLYSSEQVEKGIDKHGNEAWLNATDYIIDTIYEFYSVGSLSRLTNIVAWSVTRRANHLARVLAAVG